MSGALDLLKELEKETPKTRGKPRSAAVSRSSSIQSYVIIFLLRPAVHRANIAFTDAEDQFQSLALQVCHQRLRRQFHTLRNLDPHDQQPLHLEPPMNIPTGQDRKDQTRAEYPSQN